MGLFDEDTPRWVRLAILGMVTALVGLVAVVVLLVVRLGDDDSDPATEPSATTSRGSGTSGTSSTSVCGLPDGDQSIPTAAPAAEWEVVNGIAIPSNPAYGPGVVKDGGKERTCFAHSPLGAVFFVMNGPAGAGVDQAGAEYVGFRVLDYSGDKATVDYAVRATDGPGEGVLASVTAVFVWKDGDWTLDPGSENVDPVALASLQGYLRFSAEGS